MNDHFSRHQQLCWSIQDTADRPIISTCYPGTLWLEENVAGGIYITQRVLSGEELGIVGHWATIIFTIRITLMSKYVVKTDKCSNLDIFVCTKYKLCMRVYRILQQVHTLYTNNTCRIVDEMTATIGQIAFKIISIDISHMTSS